MALVTGAEGEFRGNFYLSFVYGSTGGVCGRSLTAGKILFTGIKVNMFPLFSVMTLCKEDIA